MDCIGATMMADDPGMALINQKKWMPHAEFACRYWIYAMALLSMGSLSVLSGCAAGHDPNGNAGISTVDFSSLYDRLQQMMPIESASTLQRDVVMLPTGQSIVWMTSRDRAGKGAVGLFDAQGRFQSGRQTAPIRSVEIMPAGDGQWLMMSVVVTASGTGLHEEMLFIDVLPGIDTPVWQLQLRHFEDWPYPWLTSVERTVRIHVQGGQTVDLLIESHERKTNQEDDALSTHDLSVECYQLDVKQRSVSPMTGEYDRIIKPYR